MDRRWMAVILVALVLGAADCSGAGRVKAPADRPPEQRQSEPKLHQPGPVISDIAAAGPHLLFAAGPFGVERSTDGGRSWVGAATGSYFQLDLVSKRVVFAVGRRKLVRTVNGGRSWHTLPRTLAAGVIIEIDFWSANSGVVLADNRPGGSYWLTRDGGQNWQRLRLPGWSLVHSGLPVHDANAVASSVCFGHGGQGWAVASRRGRQSVLESADGGRRWHVALPSRALPRHPGVGVRGCSGDAAWVFVSQSDQYGDPAALDLLHTIDRGRTWLDVLRYGEHGFPAPAVPSPPGGPQIMPDTLGPYVEWVTAPKPNVAWIAFTDVKGNQTGFGSTGDAGLNWHFWSSFGSPGTRRLTGAPAYASLPPYQLETLTAVDASHAWMLFASQPTPGPCWLYVTSNHGAKWRKIATFRSGLPPSQD